MLSVHPTTRYRGYDDHCISGRRDPVPTCCKHVTTRSRHECRRNNVVPVRLVLALQAPRLLAPAGGAGISMTGGAASAGSLPYRLTQRYVYNK